MDTQIGAASAVIWMSYLPVVEREMSMKAKPSVYQLIYIPTFTFGCELWVSDHRWQK